MDSRLAACKQHLIQKSPNVSAAVPVLCRHDLLQYSYGLWPEVAAASAIEIWLRWREPVTELAFGAQSRDRRSDRSGVGVMPNWFRRYDSSRSADAQWIHNYDSTEFSLWHHDRLCIV